MGLCRVGQDRAGCIRLHRRLGNHRLGLTGLRHDGLSGIAHSPGLPRVVRGQAAEGETVGVTSATYEVKGMTCDHCVRAVSNEIGELPGVSDVKVDLAKGEVEVTSEEPLARDVVAAAVDEAGFELVG
jgi:copper chaperone